MANDLNPDYLPNLRLGEQAPAQVTRADLLAAQAHYPPRLWKQAAIDDLAQCLASHREAADRRVVQWLRASYETACQTQDIPVDAICMIDTLRRCIEDGEHLLNGNG